MGQIKKSWGLRCHNNPRIRNRKLWDPAILRARHLDPRIELVIELTLVSDIPGIGVSSYTARHSF